MGTRAPWEIDLRHVSNEAVARVMRQFQRMFMVDQGQLEILKAVPIADRISQRRNYALRFARDYVVHPIKRKLKIEGKPFRTLMRKNES